MQEKKKSSFREKYWEIDREKYREKYRENGRKEENMTKKVLILLADGFEEVEAVGTGDVLKRLGCQVIMAGVESEKVRSSASLYICADALLDTLSGNLDSFDAVILPGGLPGATNLRDSMKVKELVKDFAAKGKIVAAICAAPAALSAFGILENTCVTGYPGCERLSPVSTLSFTGKRTERDGNIVTGKGPGVSLEFGAEIGRALGIEEEKISAVLDAMFVVRG